VLSASVAYRPPCQPALHFRQVNDLRAGAPDGIDDLSNVELLQFADANLDLRAVRNFDGLNLSDFAWQSDSGQAAICLMNGT
jgi:hypothetical protein